MTESGRWGGVGPGEDPETWTALQRALASSPGFSSHRFEHVAETGSTNDDLKVDWRRSDHEALRPGEFHRIRVADHQTAGRGQAGRSWWDVPGNGLLCSFSWASAQDDLIVGDGSRSAAVTWPMSLVVGIALWQVVRSLVHHDETVNRCGPWLKWPNDLWWGPMASECPGDETSGEGSIEAKLGGILVERSFEKDGASGPFVIGIGLNLRGPADRLPTGERRMTLEAAGISVGRPRLLALFFSHWLDLLGRGEEWQRLWSDAAGPFWAKVCEVTDPDGTTWRGRPRELTADGSLIMETRENQFRALSTFQRIRFIHGETGNG